MLQFFMNCSITGPFHKVESFMNGLRHCGSSHSVTDASRKPAPVWPPLHRPQLLSGPCSSIGSLWAEASFRVHLPATAWGPPQAAGWVSTPLWTFVDCKGTTCFTMVLTTGCRGTSAPVSGLPPPPPSSLILMSEELFLSEILSPLSQLLLCSVLYPCCNILNPNLEDREVIRGNQCVVTGGK